MARITVETAGDVPPAPKFIPNPPRFNIETPPASCFIEDINGTITRKFFATPEELSDHLNRPTLRQKGRKLYVLEGLPIEYVQTFGARFNIDVDIFDSHAVRKSGLLSNRKFPAIPGNQGKVRAFALDHPEITANVFPPPGGGTGGALGDFMLPCQTIELPEAESENGLSVKLCHVTLVSFLKEVGETSLLLLENQSWAKTGAKFQAASYHSVLANALASLPEEKQQWKPSQNHDPASTLPDHIFDAIQSPGGTLFWDHLAEIITDIVLRKWRFVLDEVVGHACASRIVPYHEIHQICELLDSNIWTLDRLGTMWSVRPRYDGLKGFKRLLAKAKGYTELFVWGQLLEQGFGTKDKFENGSGDDEGDDTASAASSKSSVHIRGGEVVDLETRQSINRVTYLGGVLLPFSIIAAIFSMGRNFQPGGDQFFIFWVIAIPVCMLTTALIYADSIRRMTLEQFAQQYGPTVVKEVVDDMVASSISDSEIISYKAGIKERLASHIPGPWNRRRRATSPSSVGYTDSDSSVDSYSTSSPQLPPGLSIDGDLLVRKKKKKEPRSWSWRFWRRKRLDKSSDLENALPSPTNSTHNVSQPPAPPTAPSPAPIPSPSSPHHNLLEPIPLGDPLAQPPSDDYPPIAGPAPPKTPTTSPPSPIPAPAIPGPISCPETPSLHSSIPDPTEIPLPRSPDSASDDWRERDSSEMIRHERSPTLDSANLDCAIDRERLSLERRMRENDEWRLTRRQRWDYQGNLDDDDDERIIEREIIHERPRHLEQSADAGGKKLALERTTKRFVEEQERKCATEDTARDDDFIPEDRGRRRERSVPRRVRRGTYYNYPERPASEADPIEVPLPPSSEELTDEDRFRMRLEKEKLEYIKKLKEEAQHKKMADAEEEYARKRAKEEHVRRQAEEHKKKEAEASKAAKGKDRAYSPVPPDRNRAIQAIKFKDAVGRKYTFPFHLVSTWAGMEEIVKQAFLHVDVLGPHVNEGHYDLVGPEDEIILPQVWESVVEPGWSVSMHMWPLPEPEQPRWKAWAPGPPYPPPPPPQGRRAGFPPPPPPPGFTEIKPGVPMHEFVPKPKKSAPAGDLGWMTGAPTSKPRKKQKSVPTRLGPPPPPSGRRGSDEVIVIEDPPMKIHRRRTGMSEKHKHGTNGGVMIGGAAKPNEELGWVRALGTIVGVKPGVQVKKQSGGSSSVSSMMYH
ncbi:hypothetical protein OCU04_006513 [Sclerotinia nivalis]|uniref:Ubiquitin-like domain-containing protein n=1 Tax=Sclerotinia nivalis TaxID=352851 RepID=A0A9X0AJY3_9HELO|nr:hypothetical protein OCU04_006513 [Sclerotinia nivalis]